MTLTIKLDGNWSSFQLTNSAPPLSVTDSAIAPSARMLSWMLSREPAQLKSFPGRSPECNLAPVAEILKCLRAFPKGLARI